MEPPASHPRASYPRPAAQGRALPPARRGVAMVMAMLFLVLFSAMALGFYASVVTGVKVSNNERNRSTAFLAGESGVQFLTYQLKQITLSGSGTDAASLFNGITSALSTQLNNTGNMLDADATGTTRNPTTATYAAGAYTLADGSQVLSRYFIPGHTGSGSTITPHFMSMGTNMGAVSISVCLVQRGSSQAVVASVVGRAGAAANPTYTAFQYDIKGTTTGTSASSSIPNGSIITYSPISASNGVTITGDVMALPATSQSAASIIGGARITGTLSYPAGYPAPVINNGGSVGATATVSSIPPQPTFDTSGFASLVPATTATPLGSSYQSGQTFSGTVFNSSSQAGSSNTFNNIRIKAGSNVTIGNNCVINGVIYVESPATLTIAGGVTVNGVIVSDNNPSVPFNAGTNNNLITINNGVYMKGTQSIDMTKVPAAETAKINALKAMFVDANGAQVNASEILAPNFGLNFQGGMTVTGAAAIVGSKFTIANGSAISLSGLMMSLGTSTFNVAGGMTITKSGLPKTWPGFPSTSSSSTTAAFNRTTYTEVTPWSYVSQP